MIYLYSHCPNLPNRLVSRQRRPRWRIPFKLSPHGLQDSSSHSQGGRGRVGRRPRVGVLREQGSNGDREMAAAFHSAGFEVWDLTVYDLIQGNQVSLQDFQGLAFVGGFSYGDALGSGMDSTLTD